MPSKDELKKQAAAAMSRAYVPYSQFKVGAALITEDGQILHGCNVENAAYGPTNCAERTALFRAISDGHAPRSFRALAVIGDTPGPISPCGICRQVMSELCLPDMPVFLFNVKGDSAETTVAELLPGAFHMPDVEEPKETGKL
ncbi:cytidine deaminase [Gorillibacterium massiliense]|uniref:cytidine deaminase n=1 Tax=Gorillibacterium massiliense TaxID=1280390 RepID=UPI00059264AB